jgi:predicted transcriptional regulator
MAHVKTAISLEESVFQRMEALARELDVPRSRLFAMAMKEFLERHDRAALLARIDEAYRGERRDPAEAAWARSSRRRLRALTQGEW